MDAFNGRSFPIIRPCDGTLIAGQSYTTSAETVSGVSPFPSWDLGFTVTEQAAPVPLSSALLFFGSGLAGLAAIKRRFNG
jgi:hypothetical protein